MIYVYMHVPTRDLLVIEADDDESARATLLENRIIGSVGEDVVQLVEMGNVVRVRERGLGMQVTGEDDLLEEFRPKS